MHKQHMGWLHQCSLLLLQIGRAEYESARYSLAEISFSEAQLHCPAILEHLTWSGIDHWTDLHVKMLCGVIDVFLDRLANLRMLEDEVCRDFLTLHLVAIAQDVLGSCALSVWCMPVYQQMFLHF